MEVENVKYAILTDMETTKNDENVLIIPDIHTKWKLAEQIIEYQKPTKTIFLGDYFDSFEEIPSDVSNTAKWLKESLSKPDRIHLFGNHDVSYAFSSGIARCSGYTDFKNKVIHNILTQEDWNKLKFFYVQNDYLLSHAGLHECYIPASKKSPDGIFKLDKIESWLTREAKTALNRGFNGTNHWIFSAGRARGGFSPKGGLVWLDFNYEFKPIPGINQIVGHTPLRREDGIYQSAENSINIDLDGMGSLKKYAMIISTGIKVYDL